MGQYPLTTYHFQVDWGGTRIGFTEVSGLTIEHEVIEYRDGASPESISSRMPGLEKAHTIILKRGILKGDNEFFRWMNTISGSQVERRDITISLLNENHEPVMTWKVKSAWPLKLDYPVLKSNASEAAIEVLEIAHEGISVESV